MFEKTFAKSPASSNMCKRSIILLSWPIKQPGMAEELYQVLKKMKDNK